MKKNHVAAFAALVHAGALCAQTAVPPDDQPPATANQPADETVVITVTKYAEVESKLGSAFSRIDNDELVRTLRPDLKQSLNTTPGIFANEAGARGGLTEVSIRGNRDDHTLIRLDGIRVNTGIFPNAVPFLTYADAADFESVEIVRGPQSTLYGSEGIGGVIALETKRGEGRPGVSVFGEAGSYGSLREGFRSGGEAGKGAYSLSYERDDTTNARPNNDLWIDRYSLRLDYQLLDNLSVQLNAHGHIGHYQEPGSVRPQDFASNDPNAFAVGESNLFSLIVNWKATRAWTQKLTVGAYIEHYSLHDPPNFPGDPNASLYVSHAANMSADWQHDVQVARNNHLTGGVEFDYLTGHDNSFPEQSVTNWAGYLQDEWEPVKHLVLTGGVRHDRYEIGGDATTYRFTGAYLFAPTDTKLRSSYGTAFKAPSFFQLFSTAPFALGNPALQPEKSRGWDAGVDQYLFNRHVVLGATYFENNIKDLIAFEETSAFTGLFLNRDTAQNHGIELSATATLFGAWKTRIACTWTESTFTTPLGTQRRDDQPRHIVSLDTSYLFFGRWLLGAGVYYVNGREATDFSTFPAMKVDLSDYYTVRVYSRFEINDHLAIFARGENITGERCQTTLGFPGLRSAFYGGAELKF
jgi:vitamin B12 transporter